MLAPTRSAMPVLIVVVLAALCHPVTSESCPTLSGLGVLYDFEAGAVATDSSGNGVDLTVYQGSPQSAPVSQCKFGGCAYFDGSSAFKLPYFSYNASAGVSISVWYKAEGAQRTWARLLQFDGMHQYRLELAAAGNQGKIKFFADNGWGEATIADSVFKARKWTHLVWTMGPGGGQVWVNGVKVLERHLASDWKGGEHVLDDNFIANREDKQRQFVGWMDQFMWISGLLTPEQIVALHCKGVSVSSGVPCTPTVPPSPPMSAFWQHKEAFFYDFDQCTITTDSAANSLRLGVLEGTPQAAPADECKFGGCAYFDGETAFTLPDFQHNSTAGLSVSLWYKRDGEQTPFARLFECNKPDQIRITPTTNERQDNIGFIAENGFDRKWIRDEIFQEDVWIHVVWTMGPGGAQIWINGILTFEKAVDNWGWEGEQTMEECVIGNRKSADKNFVGWMDQFIWFEGILSEEAIQLLFREGVLGKLQDIAVVNPSFELDQHGAAFLYVPAGPTGWNVRPGGYIVVARNGNSPWGGLDSGDGTYYLVIQNRGRYVEQTLHGLAVGEWYNVQFLAAARPMYGSDERLSVLVDGLEIFNKVPAAAFDAYGTQFQATASTAVLRFENRSPASKDRSVFVDRVQVQLGVLPHCDIPPVPHPEESVSNPSFELDPHGDSWLQAPSGPTGWGVTPAGGSFVIARNGNAPWGGLSSGVGDYFLVMQTQGSFVDQTVRGLMVGEWYRVSFKAAARPGFGSDERLSVRAGEVEVFNAILPEAFKDYDGVFQASDTAVVLHLENVSPPSLDRSVFVDAVAIRRIDMNAPLKEGENCIHNLTGCAACRERGERLACYKKDDVYAECMLLGACPLASWGWGDHQCTGTYSDGTPAPTSPKPSPKACDFYSYRQDGACVPCPTDSYAREDNYGVYACQCKAGYAMSWDREEWARIGEASAQCVPSSYCNDIIDMTTAKCWRFQPGQTTWHSARSNCRGWGGHLATVAEDSEKFLADMLIETFRVRSGSRGAVWIGASDRVRERTWRWDDGSPYNRKFWRSGRPYTGRHYGPYYDCAFIKTYGGWKPIEDYPCYRGYATSGHICTMKAQCEAGWFLHGAVCKPCPPGATSVVGKNFGVYGCECPAGQAISFDPVIGDDASGAVCVTSSSCDGIFDVATLKCWKYFDNSVRWTTAESRCNAWGTDHTGTPGHLSSIATDSDRTVANAIFRAYAISVGTLMWIGANDRADERKWEWTDGTPFRRNDNFWRWGRPYTNVHYGSWHDCGVIERTNGGNQLLDSSCNRNYRYLCSAPAFCPADSYVGGEPDRKQCIQCPGNATSSPGSNYGVEGCRCPAGFALSYQPGKPAECMEAPHCDGVLDVATLKCWKLTRASRIDWAPAESKCKEWGGHLSSVSTEGEDLLAKRMMQAAGFGIGDGVWVGANDRRDERDWEWSDGTPFGKKSWRWAWGRPYTDVHYGSYHDCGVLSLVTWGGQLADQDCTGNQGDRAQGYLCSLEPQCAEGFFLHHDGGLAECRRCPNGGSSTRGSNFGVYSCRCPEGMTLPFREGQHEAQVKCVESRGCNGVQDMSTGLCWTLHSERESWWSAGSRCAAWGGKLSSIISESDRSLAKELMVSAGVSAVGSTWVGASDQANERKWTWDSGEPYVYSAGMWAWGRPQTDQHYGSYMDCAVLQNRGRPTMKDVECDGHGVAGIQGSLCTKPFRCPDGMYMTRTLECARCPSNGTSVEGSNYGVYGCSCPAGTALSFNMHVADSSDVVVECVESATGCDGILDMYTLKCWKGVWGSPGWNGAENHCKGWGGHLASILNRQELMLARIMHDALGFQALDALWVGANDLAKEHTWRWTDGSPFNRQSALWWWGRPHMDVHYGSYHDVGKLLEGKLIDGRVDTFSEAKGFLCKKAAWEARYNGLVPDPPKIIDVCRGCWYSVLESSRTLIRQGHCASFCLTLSAAEADLEAVAPGTLGEPLIAVDLSGNRLAPLRPEWFEGAQNVELVRLANNGLSDLDLEPAAFKALPALRHLDIRTNSIAHIDPEVLQYWEEIRQLQAAGNPLTCQPATSRAYTVDIDFEEQGLGFCMVRGCTVEAVEGLLGNLTEVEQGVSLSALQTVVGMFRLDVVNALDEVAANRSLWAPRDSPNKRCWCFPFLRCFDIRPPDHRPPKPARIHEPTVIENDNENNSTAEANVEATPAPALSVLAEDSELEVVTADDEAAEQTPWGVITGAVLGCLVIGVLLLFAARRLSSRSLATLKGHHSNTGLVGELAFELGTLKSAAPGWAGESAVVRGHRANSYDLSGSDCKLDSVSA